MKWQVTHRRCECRLRHWDLESTGGGRLIARLTKDGALHVLETRSVAPSTDHHSNLVLQGLRSLRRESKSAHSF